MSTSNRRTNTLVLTKDDGPSGLRAPVEVMSDLFIRTNTPLSEQSDKAIKLICGESRTDMLINRHVVVPTSTAVVKSSSGNGVRKRESEEFLWAAIFVLIIFL